MKHLCNQGVILAAGEGKRMGSLTDYPKSLFKFNNKTLLERNIDNMLNAGIKDIIVVGGYKIEMLEPIISKYDGVTLLYNEFYKEYGTMQSLGIVEDRINTCFIQTEADFIGEFRGINELLNSSGNSIICSEQRKNSGLAVPVFNNGKLIKISRDLNDINNEVGIRYIGPSHFTKEILVSMNKYNKNNNNILHYEEALSKAVCEDKFTLSLVYINNFNYYDLNTEDDIPEIGKIINMLDGEVF